MQLRKAHVTNFKIVEDSKEFSLDRVTCLVGKNESGKTALLEALYRLNPYYAEDNCYNKVEEYPRRFLSDYDERHAGDNARVITTHWELEDADVGSLEAVLGRGCVKSKDLVIYKRYGDKNTIWTVLLDERKIVTNLIDGAGLHTEE